MVEIAIGYEGRLRTRATHGPSREALVTDAPVDNHGRGESFSPTDLVATALGTCMLTIMGIYAERHDIDLAGTRVSVEKHMGTEPRRIARLPVIIEVPLALDERHRTGLQNAAMSCPVKKSVHPDIEIPVDFRYGV